ncbi:MAG TPA: hypothetical protein VLB90_10265 [Pseudomonadales bacterium]|nr:hypothetical protein [Pseudomonadales bacterium]
MNAVYSDNRIHTRQIVVRCLVSLIAVLPLAGCQWLSQQDWLPGHWSSQDNDTPQDQAALVRQQSINSLIAKGNLAFAKDRLSIPANDNALMYYREVLKMDPHNWDAQEGLHQISKRFRKLSRAAHGNGDSKQAFKYLHQAEAISGPDAPGNRKLRRELQETQAGQDQRALDRSLQEQYKTKKNQLDDIQLEDIQRTNSTSK